LAFSYDTREARLGPLTDDPGPELYDLCRDHADRTKPPHGWSLHDDRPDEPDVPGVLPRDLGSERTVALLAAALHGDGGRDGHDRPASGEDPAPPGMDQDLLATADPDAGVTDDGDGHGDAWDELAALAADHPDLESASEADRDEDVVTSSAAVPAGGSGAPAPRTVPGARRERD
jgi:hypothetical protein